MRAHRAAQAKSGVKPLAIALDENIVEDLDDLAQRLGMTRSEAVAHLIERHAGPKKKRPKPAPVLDPSQIDMLG